MKSLPWVETHQLTVTVGGSNSNGQIGKVMSRIKFGHCLSLAHHSCQSPSMETRSQQRKVNRVAATAALQSPPHPTSTTPAPRPRAARDTLSSAGSCSSSTSSGGAHNPLPVHVQAQLCEDIEAHGGVATLVGFDHSLSTLLNHLIEVDPLRKSLYKETGDPVRRQIQQKVYNWQKLWSQGLYEKQVLWPQALFQSASKKALGPKRFLLPRSAFSVWELLSTTSRRFFPLGEKLEIPFRSKRGSWLCYQSVFFLFTIVCY